MAMSERWGFTTKAIHGGKMPDTHKSVAPPIYQTATYYYDTAEEGARLGQEIPPGYVYTRWANPTTRALEEKIALLEGGEDALATASGMAAVSCAVLTAVRPGDHAIAPSAIYQATYQLFADMLPGYRVETTLLPDSSLPSYERALRPNTKLVFIETPTNPMLGITDIEKVAALARAHGATTIADNTWASPYNQTPLANGVDVVVHSATKYLGGHHDVTAGGITGKAGVIQRAEKEGGLLGAAHDPLWGWFGVRGVGAPALAVGGAECTAQTRGRGSARQRASSKDFYASASGSKISTICSQTLITPCGAPKRPPRGPQGPISSLCVDPPREDRADVGEVARHFLGTCVGLITSVGPSFFREQNAAHADPDRPGDVGRGRVAHHHHIPGRERPAREDGFEDRGGGVVPAHARGGEDRVEPARKPPAAAAFDGEELRRRVGREPCAEPSVVHPGQEQLRPRERAHRGELRLEERLFRSLREAGIVRQSVALQDRLQNLCGGHLPRSVPAGEGRQSSLHKHIDECVI